MATLVNMAEEEKTPEVLALEGFDDDSGATVVDVEFKRYDDELVAQFGDLGHAVVQVGFPGTTACYYLSYFHYQGAWRQELPPEGDPRHPLTNRR